MDYKIIYHKNYFKDVKKIPKHHENKIKRVLKTLLQNPRKLPSNTDTIKSKIKGIYRTRIGKYRLIFQVNKTNKHIYVIGVGPRGEVYKIMNRLLS